MYTKEDLTDQSVLMELLGYIDERSFVKWCMKNNIPIIKIGLKKYILSHFLTQIIDNQLVKFVKDDDSKEKQIKQFVPENEIIAKYLSKYESASKIKTIRKRPT